MGVIGLGRASTSMLPSLAAHPGVKVVAAADVRPDARQKFAREFQAQTFDRAEALCSSPDVDAVYIATPHQFHAEHVLLAAEHGKHALVEKPMALTLEDCDRMIAAAERTGVRLQVGPTHGSDPAVLEMHRIIESGEVGRVGMVLSFDYTNFLYRPRRPEELDTSLGGGIIFNQVPHQIDIVRLLAGGSVRSVRAVTGVWDKSRPTEGSHMTFLDFSNGAAATVVYSGYDQFDSDEMHFWIGEGGNNKAPEEGYGRARQALRAASSPAEEAAMKAATGYGGARQKRAGGTAEGGERHHPHFGVTLVSGEGGDLRASPDGVFVYGPEGRREVPVPLGRAVPDKGRVVDEFHAAIVEGAPLIHDGQWGKATLEVCLGILESARTRREVILSQAGSLAGATGAPS